MPLAAHEAISQKSGENYDESQFCPTMIICDDRDLASLITRDKVRNAEVLFRNYQLSSKSDTDTILFHFIS